MVSFLCYWMYAYRADFRRNERIWVYTNATGEAVDFFTENS